MDGLHGVIIHAGRNTNKWENVLTHWVTPTSLLSKLIRVRGCFKHNLWTHSFPTLGQSFGLVPLQLLDNKQVVSLFVHALRSPFQSNNYKLCFELRLFQGTLLLGRKRV